MKSSTTSSLELEATILLICSSASLPSKLSMLLVPRLRGKRKPLPCDVRTGRGRGVCRRVGAARRDLQFVGVVEGAELHNDRFAVESWLQAAQDTQLQTVSQKEGT